MLDGVLGHQPGVERRPARDDDDLVDLAQLAVGDAYLVELEHPLRVVPAEQRVGDGPRLLEDLLAHEPVVAALLGGREVPVDVVARALGRRAVEADHLDTLTGDRDDLVLAELEGLAGVLDERRDVGADEVLAVADADHERGVTSCRHHARGVLGVDGDQRERAFEPGADLAHRVGQRAAVVERSLQQVGRDLGVGLGEQVVAGRLDLGPELGEVLDDAVVHQGDPTGVAEVRVGVDVVGGPVGGPPGVPDAGRGRWQRLVGEHLLEVGELARALAPRDRAIGHQRDPGGVVSAVLEASQALDDLRLLVADVPHDPAHARESTGAVGPRGRPPPERRPSSWSSAIPVSAHA